jgi:hypothetical protein
VPFLFDLLPKGIESLELYRSMASAAERLGSLAFVPWAWARNMPASVAVVPVVSPDEVKEFEPRTRPPMVELDGWDAASLERLRGKGIPVAVRLSYAQPPLPVAESGVGILHYVADYHGRTPDGFVLEALRSVHDDLVRGGVREQVTLLSSGGVAAAEHVPKAIIAGADAVALDLPLILAMQGRLIGECRSRESARIDMPAAPPDWREQRLLNLAGSWRDQLLEVLGRWACAKSGGCAARSAGRCSPRNSSAKLLPGLPASLGEYDDRFGPADDCREAQRIPAARFPALA